MDKQGKLVATVHVTHIDCDACGGTGRVKDPQHGHDRKCSKCEGKGILLKDVN